MSSNEASDFRPSIGARALAAGASFFLPGFGQFLAGRTVRAAIFFVLWFGLLVTALLALASPTAICCALWWALASVVVMIVATVDAFHTAGRHPLLANGAARIYAAVAAAGALVVFLWVIADMFKKSNLGFGAFISQTLAGNYALTVLIAGLALAAIAFATADKISAGVVRFGLALLIPAMIIWPLDKAAQATLLSMFNTVVAPLTVTTGNSMLPNLIDQDTVFVHLKAPIRRFDLVAYTRPGHENDGTTVKRVYGLPGEAVEVISGDLYINGVPIGLPPGSPKLEAPSMGAYPAIGWDGNQITLRSDEYYVLGDNLASSFDSRYPVAFPLSGPHQPGAIPLEAIKGRVTYRLWPAGTWGK